MKKQRVQEPSIALAILSSPCCAWKNGKANALKEAWPVRHVVLLRHTLLLKPPSEIAYA
jgi:hypothetical protein